MGIFGKLTVRENMLLATGRTRLRARRSSIACSESFPALKLKWDSPAGSLSGGQKQMLAIGRAIIEPRRLLLIDEPTKGLSPAMVDQLVEALLRLKREQHHDPAGRAEFSRGGGGRRRCRGDGRGPHHP